VPVFEQKIQAANQKDSLNKAKRIERSNAKIQSTSEKNLLYLAKQFCIFGVQF
jgi:hypothetical protein